MKTVLLSAVLLSSLALAGNPAGVSNRAQPQAPARWNGGEGMEGKGAEFQHRMRMMLVVGLADALSLNEGEAIALADKMKAFDEKRAPVREQMRDAMKTLKAASEGDQVALGQVDNATAKVFDGRQQMAAIDKEMYLAISKDLTPQKKAQLAVFLAKFHAKAMGGMGGHERGGRFHKDR